MPERRIDRTDDVRRRCYDGVRTAMKSELNEYYHVHPDWLLDDRSQAKLAMMARVLTGILKCLDGYDIREKPAASVK